MRRILAVILCGVIFTSSAKRILLDTIAAVGGSPNKPWIITAWDVARPPLGGPPVSLDDLILQNLICDDAERLKFAVSDIEATKILEQVIEQNEMSNDEFKERVKDSGYCVDEVLTMLSRMQMVRQLLDYQVSSRVAVSQKVIQKYYDSHPITEEGKCEVQYALVPFQEGTSLDKQRAELANYVAGGCKGDGVTVAWKRPFLLEEAEVAPEKHFILEIEEGGYNGPIEANNGFEIYHMKSKRPKRLLTLEERRRDIVSTLSQDSYSKLFDEYRQRLLDRGMVVKFNMPGA